MNISILNDNITELSETFFAHLTLVSPECESHTILLSPNETKVEIKDYDSKYLYILVCKPSFTLYFSLLIIVVSSRICYSISLAITSFQLKM